MAQVLFLGIAGQAKSLDERFEVVERQLLGDRQVAEARGVDGKVVGDKAIDPPCFPGALSVRVAP